MKTKILYIEDEPHLGKIVAESLEKESFEVLWETDGTRVLKQIDEFEPDICVLDIMLPDIDGYSLCEKIKSKQTELPVIFLTAKAETVDLVKGFEAGGTDYIKKPFSIEELIVRIHNQLNHTFSTDGKLTEDKNDKSPNGHNHSIKLGKYTFFPDRFELLSPNGIIQLSLRDKEILSLLAESKNKVIDRKKLLLEVWGDDSFFNSRNLDVYINKIRDYLNQDPKIKIQTLKGKGYLFLVD